MRFEWDRENVRRNLCHHGVPLDELVAKFCDPLSATFDELDHSTTVAKPVANGREPRHPLDALSRPDRNSLLLSIH
jgi:uncharacterized DUF497 family protein